MIQISFVLLMVPCVVVAWPWRPQAEHSKVFPPAGSGRGPPPASFFPWDVSSHSTQGRQVSWGSSKQQHSSRGTLQDTPAQSPAAGPLDEAAALADAKDPTKKTTWDSEPSYSSHYSSDAERPNMCKVAHKVPAPLDRQPYNFTAEKKDYVPYLGTSVVRDSQLMLLRLYYRWACGCLAVVRVR